MLLALLSTLSFLAPGPQGEELRLSLDGPMGGDRTTVVRLHSTSVGAPAWLAAGPAGSYDLLGPGEPLLGVYPYGAGQFVRGKIGADGVFELPVRFPGPSFLPGKRLAFQGVLLDADGHYHVSARASLIGEPAADAAWTEAAARLAPELSTQATTAPCAADFDRDGDLDVIVLGEDSVLFLRNDVGTLVEDGLGRFPGVVGRAGSLASADVDRDGAPDLVLVGRFDALGNPLPPAVLRNDGSGVFTIADTLVSALEAASRVRAGDVDGDGDPDLILADGGQHAGSGSNYQTLALFLNQGGRQGGTAGQFAEDLGFGSDSRFNHNLVVTADLAVADVDRDGDLDVFLARTSGGGAENELLINDGTGAFDPRGSQQLPVFFDKSGASLFEDFTGDGYPDLFVCNSHWTVGPAESGDLLINRGAAAPGHFDDADPTHFPAWAEEDLIVRNFAVAGDVDLDGDRDLIVLPHEFPASGGTGLIGEPILFLNRGGAQNGRPGSFEKDVAFWGPGTTFVAGGGLLFDLDQDGDLDFLANSIGGIFSGAKVGDHLLVNQLLR